MKDKDTFWKLWFVFCALLAIASISFAAWFLIRVLDVISK